jgi:hypothetical protein
MVSMISIHWKAMHPWSQKTAVQISLILIKETFYSIDPGNKVLVWYANVLINSSLSLNAIQFQRRRISTLSSGSASDDDSRSLSRVSQDTTTHRSLLKRKANIPNKPAKRPKIADSNAHSAADDPARKYCLAQLQNVLHPIFEQYAPQSQSSEKAKVGDDTLAGAYANALESHLFQTFSEVDRSGSQAVGQKYK